MDRGATPNFRDDVVEVDPIRFLDTEDVLDRSAARAELNLDPEKTVVLIQLGSPMNRDTVSLSDRVMQTAARYPDLQVAQLEWAISNSSRELWPELVTLRGFPIARYYRAFETAPAPRRPAPGAKAASLRVRKHTVILYDAPWVSRCISRGCRIGGSEHDQVERMDLLLVPVFRHRLP